MKRGVRIATSKTVEMKNQTDNANGLLPEAKKRKLKENSSSKTKIIPKQENTIVPSLMSTISVIGNSILKRKKRTIVKRRRLSEMTEPMRRLANTTQHVFLSPKDTNGKPNVRFLIPHIEDKNELVISPKEENDPTEHPIDEIEAKRRRGRPSKHQVATSGSPRTGHSLHKLAIAAQKQGSDRKTSLLGRVLHGVDQSGGTHQTPLDKIESKQLGPRPQPRPLLPSPLLELPQPPLPPPPQPWPAMSPAWLQSEPYIEPFTNVGTSSTNGADYKGKQVVVDDENDKGKKPSFENNLDFLFENPKGGVKIHDGSNENAATDKESIPPVDRDLLREFINEISGAKKNPIHSVQDGGNNRKPKKTGMLQTSQRKNVKSKIHVSPSTYLRPAARKIGGSRLSTGGAASSVQSPPLTQGMQPPRQREAQPLLPWGGQSRLTHDFMNQVQEPPQGGRQQWAVPDSHDKEIQRCAEAIYGKEAFANGVPPLAGPFTAMMIFAMNPNRHDALLVFSRGWPPQSAFRTNTTATRGHQFLPPPPPLTTSGHDATGQEELELASTSEPNLLCHNSLAPNNGNLLVQPDTHETFQPPQALITPPQHHQEPPQQPQEPPQLVTNPFLYNYNLFQQQSNLFMPTPMLPQLPPQLPPQMAVFGVPNFPGQYLLGYPGSSGDGNWVMGNWGYQGPPPPGI
ncbi:hypothetical protein L6452_42915 [Arctium lappa]|uniref:Uncharacterized protein n=1 Tax=Arctium lappa TaxID=4217 RepID=A0ACB8XLB2_ARCLA|nr:hypothetical protein L6452_42915 [Arctium lappa]